MEKRSDAEIMLLRKMLFRRLESFAVEYKLEMGGNTMDTENLHLQKLVFVDRSTGRGTYTIVNWYETDSVEEAFNTIRDALVAEFNIHGRCVGEEALLHPKQVYITTARHSGHSYMDRMIEDWKKEIRDNTVEYCKNDALMTSALYNSFLNAQYGKPKATSVPKIENVIFNDPATIVFWKDGTKTVVKAQGEPYDPEKGLAMAISRKALGNKRDYYNVFKKWLKKFKKRAEVENPALKTITMGLKSDDRAACLAAADLALKTPREREYCQNLILESSDEPGSSCIGLNDYPKI